MVSSLPSYGARAFWCGSMLAVAVGVASCSSTPPTPIEPDAAVGARPAPSPEPDGAKQELATYGLEHVGVNLPGEDICERDDNGELKNPIAEGTYQGLLRNARCDQQKFITMARVAKSLGVTCKHCHVSDPNDPNKELYAEYTDNKRIANWMYKTFVQGLRPKDGSPMFCTSCHQATPDDQCTPKMLKDPRDQDYAQEWMHEVMTTKFVEANGKRLRCKTCHVGMAPDTEGWIKDVIRRLRYEGEVQRRPDEAGDTGE